MSDQTQSEETAAAAEAPDAMLDVTENFFVLAKPEEGERVSLACYSREADAGHVLSHEELVMPPLFRLDEKPYSVIVAHETRRLELDRLTPFRQPEWRVCVVEAHCRASSGDDEFQLSVSRKIRTEDGEQECGLSAPQAEALTKAIQARDRWSSEEKSLRPQQWGGGFCGSKPAKT